MTRPVALPLRANVLVIVNGDLATVRRQLADVDNVASVEAYEYTYALGGVVSGVIVTIDHDTVNTADAIRRATGTTLPTPVIGAVVVKPHSALNVPLEREHTKSHSDEMQTFSGGLNAIGEETRQLLSASFTPLPTPARTLPAPRIEILRLPVDVVIVPDELLEIYSIAGEVVTTTLSYFLDRPGSDKTERDPAGVFSQPAHPPVRLPDGIYGDEYVSECLSAEAEALADRAMRIVSEADFAGDRIEGIFAGIEAVVEAQADDEREATRERLTNAVNEIWLDVPAAPMRYTYKGDKLTDPALVGLQCNPVLRADGKCIVSVKMATALVVDERGNQHVVLRRLLRLNAKAKLEAAA